MPPPPGAGEISVAVACCGICGTDMHEYLHGPLLVPTQPHPLTGRMAPLTLGHEISGWVRAAGGGVESPQVGDLVVLNALLPCGACEGCRAGAPQRCATLGHLGQSADGGLAEFLTVPADMAVTVASTVDPAVAVLAEPLSVAMHAVAKAGEPSQLRCLVVGAGTIGLLVSLVLADRGNDVQVIDNDDRRRDVAERLGLGFALTATQPADVVFECSGGAAAVGTALQSCRAGGLVVLCGFPDEEPPLDVTALVLRELRVVGSVGHLVEPDLRRAVDFLEAHTERLSALVTQVVPLDRAVSGLDVLAGPDRHRQTKIVVSIGAE